jgi:hypothetical protein
MKSPALRRAFLCLKTLLAQPAIQSHVGAGLLAKAVDLPAYF